MTQNQQNASKIRRLHDLNQELENYFRNTIIPQLFVDADLLLRKFTPPAMKQFDLSENHMGKSIKEVCHNIRYPTFVEDIQQVIDTGKALEKEIQTTDFRWYQMNILPYIDYNENKTNGVIITFVNITDRIRTLKEVEKLNADHETFIYAVSHDIKGPLNNLEGLIENLKEEADKCGVELKSLVEMVDFSLSGLKKMVSDLGDITRTRYELSKGADQINIENILEEVGLALKDKIIDSKARITTDINVYKFNFSRKNLRSIIYNLLSNAIKYKAPDRNPEILIKTKRSDNYILLSVTDNGLGIEESKIQTIFSEFSRISDLVEGTGVGLFIVKKIVDNIGGKIEVDSTVGKGSTFNVYIKNE